MLHLALIGVNVLLKHLLCPNPNFKMIDFLLESLRHVALIHMLPHANIRGKRIIWLPEDIQCVSDWRNEWLRMVPCNKVFVAAIIANGHQPGSIWLQLMH